MVLVKGTSEIETPEEFRALSSIAADVWHAGDREPGAYEWWYFDAISDDKRDALVIIFLGNFTFSPRYNRAAAELQPTDRPVRFPALAVCLYRDGRPVFRAINEYTANEFTARTDHPVCHIGRSSFHLQKTSGALSYVVTLDEPIRRGRRMTATLEWKVTQGDFSPGESDDGKLSQPGTDNEARVPAHEWNMVAPRCCVSGKIAVSGRNNTLIMQREFRGTGYHDHNRDRRWMASTIARWQWGRAHFDDETTVVFYYYRECDRVAPVIRVFTICRGARSIHKAQITEEEARRHYFGLRYPRRLRFDFGTGRTEETLRVRQGRMIDSSFFYLRFLSEMTLETGGGQTWSATGITEQLAPQSLRWRWLDWLTDMRIGRNGAGSLLP